MQKARRIGCRGGVDAIRLPQRHRITGNAAVVVGNFWDWKPLPFGVCQSVSLYRSESLPFIGLGILAALAVFAVLGFGAVVKVALDFVGGGLLEGLVLGGYLADA